MELGEWGSGEDLGGHEGDSGITLPAIQTLLSKAKVLSTLQAGAYTYLWCVETHFSPEAWVEDLQHTSPGRTHLSIAAFSEALIFLVCGLFT